MCLSQMRAIGVRCYPPPPYLSLCRPGAAAVRFLPHEFFLQPKPVSSSRRHLRELDIAVVVHPFAANFMPNSTRPCCPTLEDTAGNAIGVIASVPFLLRRGPAMHCPYLNLKPIKPTRVQLLRKRQPVPESPKRGMGLGFDPNTYGGVTDLQPSLTYAEVEAAFRETVPAALKQA